jgi:hypothetical protein
MVLTWLAKHLFKFINTSQHFKCRCHYRHRHTTIAALQPANGRAVYAARVAKFSKGELLGLASGANARPESDKNIGREGKRGNSGMSHINDVLPYFVVYMRLSGKKRCLNETIVYWTLCMCMPHPIFISNPDHIHG